MKLYRKTGELLADIKTEDSSYAYGAIMEDASLTIHACLPEHIEIPVGTYCTFQGERYTLMRPENIRMNHTRSFEYTIEMQGASARAGIWKFKNPVDGRLKFSLTAKPREHLQMIVDNLNMRESGWTIGTCVEDTEHTICYDHHYIKDALAVQAEEFKTEYEIKGRTISLRKVEYDRENPLPLSYGRARGFVTGVTRRNETQTPPVEILYVQGGEKNLDPSTYKNRELLLPAQGTIKYDGSKFEDEQGFIVGQARTYAVSTDRRSIFRTDAPTSTLTEDSIDCSDIYPKREGTISEVVLVDKDKHFYDFTDQSIPPELNFEDCLIKGQEMTVIFQTGMLAGREFEVKYHHLPTKDGKQGRRFEIVPQEIDGITMPDETFKPAATDKYAVFNCSLPEAYICNNGNKTGAEWEMFRQAVKYKYDHEVEKFTFAGKLDGIWAKKQWNNIGGRLRVGSFVLFTDERFQKEGVLVRITALKQYISNPHSPEITLSNATMTGSVAGTIRELAANEQQVDERRNEAVSYTRRRWRDSKETAGMLAKLIEDRTNALSQQFTDAIAPINIQTMQMLVGDESLQFRYVTSDMNPQPTTDGITYEEQSKQLSCPERIIQHMTIGISSISSSHGTQEYRFWNVAPFISPFLDSPETKYYLYINAPENAKQRTPAGYELDTAPRPFMAGGHYNLLVGILNSEYEGTRSFVPLYGFTEILPSRITTEKIVSGDGLSFWDMVTNAFKLGNALEYNVNGDRRLMLQGTMVQSQSGEVAPIGCYRGAWNNSTTYFEGDEVTSTIGGITSSYRCMSKQPITGISPADPNYWQLIASGGTNGKDGVGRDGKDGKDGKDGTNGTNGTNGKDGKDGTSVSIKDSVLGHFATDTDFKNAQKQDGKYLVDFDSTLVTEDKYRVIFISVNNQVAGKTQAGIGDGYIDSAGNLWIAVEYGWKNVGKIKGEDGKDGVSYIDTVEYYQWHDKEDVAPTGTWSKNEIPPRPANKTYRFLWNYEEINKSDGTKHTTPKHAISCDGKGVMSITEFYMITATSDEPDIASKDWTRNKLTPTIEKPYLWNQEDTLFTDGNRMTTVHLIAQRGKDGTNGKDGVGVLDTFEFYQWHNSGMQAPTGQWTQDVMPLQPADPTYRYLWNYEVIQMTDGTQQPTTKHVISCDGKGIKNIEEFYAITSTSEEPTPSSFIWRREKLLPTQGLPYLWNKEVTTFNDETTQTRIHLMAQRGTDGERGQDGQDGEYTEYRFAQNGSTTTPPALKTDIPEPEGWSTSTPTISTFGYYTWATKARKSNPHQLLELWCSPYRITPYDGKDGQKGESPAAVFRGIFDPNKTYYGNRLRLDCVKYGNAYYIAQITAGEFRGSEAFPTNTSKWNPFGGSFESIATGMLLAENANIAGWIFRDNKLYSQNDVCFLDGVTGNISGVGILRRNMFHITSQNLKDYLIVEDAESSWYSVDYTKTGSLISVDCDMSIGGQALICYMPCIYADVGMTEERKNRARSFIGTQVIIYNNGPRPITLSGAITYTAGDERFVSTSINPHEIGMLTCTLEESKRFHKEQIYWLIKKIKC